MASKNRLINGPVVAEDAEEVVVSQSAPAWRYHESCPGGKVCKTDKELQEADAAGWQDHPGKVALLPGFEKLFEGNE